MCDANRIDVQLCGHMSIYSANAELASKLSSTFLKTQPRERTQDESRAILMSSYTPTCKHTWISYTYTLRGEEVLSNRGAYLYLK